MRVADFERLYAEHADSLFSFFAYRTGNPALADDLLGDTFERVLRARRKFDPARGSERTWLFAIGVNLLRDLARRRQIEARAVERLAASPEEERSRGALLAVETRLSLETALMTLTPAEREAIALRFGGDLTLREVAEVTGDPTSTVESRIYRALQKLGDVLD